MVMVNDSRKNGAANAIELGMWILGHELKRMRLIAEQRDVESL